MSRVGREGEKFALRLPDGLRGRIKEVADQNSRSMNSEIVMILERAIFDPMEMKKGEAA
jgi:hypothetical protein